MFHDVSEKKENIASVKIVLTMLNMLTYPI